MMLQSTAWLLALSAAMVVMRAAYHQRKRTQLQLLEPSTLHFVTFAAAKYTGSLQRIRHQALEMGVFATVHALTKDDLNPQFWEAHAEFVAANPRGYGYWLWKPWVVLRALHDIPEGHVLVYADAGCTLNRGGSSRMQEYASMAMASADGMVCFRQRFDNGCREDRWTKGDVLRLMGCTSPACRNGEQLMATTFLIRNSPANRRLMQRWYALCIQNSYVNITDAPSHTPNAPDFKEHRHDQSLFSLLVRSRGCDDGVVILPDEVNILYPSTPIWGTRKRQ